MTGIKGTKQHKSLTQEQVEELKHFSVLTQDQLEPFLIKYNISFDALKRRATASGLSIPFGYSYAEYLSNPALQSSYNKSNLQIDCPCGKTYITVLFGFHKRKYKDPVCDECYRKTYAYDLEWRENNSKAQRIAQNRPEVIAKQVVSQKKRYQQEGVLDHYRAIGKRLWENPDYRKKVVANSSIAKAGTYHGLSYQSSIELAFILWCENSGKSVVNYAGEGIPYNWAGTGHHYYPDFLVDGNTIVEVKGHGGVYERDYDQNQAKFAALRIWCKSRELCVRVVFDTDLGNRAIKEARTLHGTLGKKDSPSL
jgi:hypothetical protein